MKYQADSLIERLRPDWINKRFKGVYMEISPKFAYEKNIRKCVD